VYSLEGKEESGKEGPGGSQETESCGERGEEDEDVGVLLMTLR